MDGKASPFEIIDKLERIETGPVPSPRTVVSIQYCIGKVKTYEPCTIEKDELDDDSGVSSQKNTWSSLEAAKSMSAKLARAVEEVEREGVSESWSRDPLIVTGAPKKMAKNTSH